MLEYLVWRVYDDVIDWFVLTEDEYRPLAPDAAGILYSQTFAGLRLASNALLAGDFAGVLSELSNGIATPEHSAFVTKLGTASAR